MSLRYRDSSGNETIVSGLTPGGDIEAGASAIRHATVSLPALAAGAYGEVNATFSDGDMPDIDYVILVDSIGTTARNFSFSDKTISGFKVTHANISDNASGAQTLKLIAWKIYSVQHDIQNTEAIAALQSVVPSGAGTTNQLTTKSYVDAADAASDSRLDNVEDVIPTGTTITNQLVNKSELQTAIDNVEIDVDDQIDSTSTNPVENQVIAAALNKKENKIFTGTQAEWNALSAQEKAQFKFVTLTDDENYVGNVTNAIANGEGAAVSSNAVYNYPINSINDDEHRPPTSGAVYDYVKDKIGTTFKAVPNAAILTASGSKTITLAAGTQLLLSIFGSDPKIMGSFLINTNASRIVAVADLYKGNSLTYTTSTGSITFNNGLSAVNPSINILVFSGSFTIPS